MSARTCQDVRADLSVFLDGDLDAAVADEIRRHLEGCAVCRSELELLRLTVGALRRLPEVPPPAAILAGVRARLRPEPWYRRLLDDRRWRLGAPVGALATVLVVIGISLFQARHPDLPQSITQGPLPKSLAPSAPAPPAKPLPTALSAIDSKAEQSQPARPEPQAAALKDALREESRRAEYPAAATKEAPAVLARMADRSASLENARLAGAKAKAPLSPEIRIVCLLPPDGETVDDLERLLRREGAGDIVVSVLEPRAVREAFAPHHLRLGSLPEPARGWTVTARVPPRALARLIGILSNRTSLRILEQPPAAPAAENSTAPLELQITVFR